MLNLTDAGASALQKLTYAYDASSNVSSITDGVTAANSQTLGYDVLDHLTSATGSYGSLSYSYSPIGNRLTQTVGGIPSSYTYAPHSNQLTKITSGAATQTLSYTAAGNIAAITPNASAATTYTYNQWNRLASVTTPVQFAQYAYDAFGHRLVKTLPGTSDSLYQYDQAGNLLEEISNGVATDYVYLDSRPVVSIQPSSGKVYFLHDDRLGTPQMATDAGQGVQWAASYQPFGQTNIIGTITQNLRFPGQEFDAASGLYHNAFRDYVSGLGRYVESDPIGIAGKLNTYTYALSNPQRITDPKGTNPIKLAFKIGIAGFAECWAIPECRNLEYQLLAKLSELVNEAAECHERLEDSIDTAVEEASSAIRNWLSENQSGSPPAPFSPESASTPFGPNNPNPVQVICQNWCSTLAPPEVPLADPN